MPNIGALISPGLMVQRLYLLVKTSSPKQSELPRSALIERLSILRFPLAVAIVVLHADRNHVFSDNFNPDPVFGFIGNALINGLDGARVQTFFLLGGFLFFLGVEENKEWFVRKISARVRSVLMPLVIWNLLWLAILAIAQNVPFTAAMLHSSSLWAQPIANFSFDDFRAAILGGQWGGQPLVYPLWFLRDLFVLVLVSPLLYLLISRSYGMFTLAAGLLWCFKIQPLLVADSAFFPFILGSQIAISRRSIFYLDRIGLISALAWILLLMPGVADWIGAGYGHLRAIVVVIALLSWSGWVTRHEELARIFRKAGGYGFFIFLAHEPLVTFLRNLSLRIVNPHSPSQHFALFIVVSISVIALSMIVYELMRYCCPRALMVLTGMRVGERLETASNIPVASGKPLALRSVDREFEIAKFIRFLDPLVKAALMIAGTLWLAATLASCASMPSLAADP